MARLTFRSRGALATGVLFAALLAFPASSPGAGFPLAAFAEPSAPLANPAAHPLHLTVGKLIITGSSAVLDIRIFWDDLTLEVREHSRNPAAEVRGAGVDPRLVESYLNHAVVLTFDGVVARGTLRESSQDGDANRYIVHYTLPAPPRQAVVRHRVLLDLYEDQKNVLHVQKDGGRERAFYFARRVEQQSIRF